LSASRRAIGIWLIGICAMIFVMVVIGALTRLTESGLSMTDWRPVTGWLPPIGEAQWQAELAKYRASPQYQQVNAGMSVAEFRQIFWLEYVHRLWGRLIGLAFALPFLWFLLRGRITRELAPKLVALFVLGGLQGALGWYMVRSGLVDVPAVSQYRLAAHLTFAILIYALTLWLALSLLREAPPPASPPALRQKAVALMVFAVFVIASGGFVAGLDAGYAYSDFPLMDGHWLPPGGWDLEPGWLNFFENVATVQFQHRLLGIALALGILALWGLARRARLPQPARGIAHALPLLALVQVTLGILTLRLHMPIALATLHQANALLVLTALVAFAFELTGRRLPAAARSAPA
jgi:cytochrome c oxidase assembly protein subunit 15